MENNIDWIGRLYGLLATIGEKKSINHPQNAEVALRLAIPIYLVQFVLAIEDKRFWVHPGIDPIGIGRAVIMRLLRRGQKQGASTITEQILKLRAGNTHFKDLSERIRRAGSSLILILRESKIDILVEYLQRVYLGGSCYGLSSAARNYFGCLNSELSPAQSFFISERIASPNKWRPGRLKNTLRKMVIRKLLGHDIIYLPMIYGKFFGRDAEAKVIRIIS